MHVALQSLLHSFCLHAYCFLSAIPFSGQRWHGGAGEPGRDPEAPTALPQRGPPPAVPVLPGERPAPPRPAGPTALVPERKGLSNSTRV